MKYQNKRKGEASLLREYLDDFVRSSRPIRKGLEQVRARDAWFKVMGKNMINYTTDVQLDRKTLYVKLNSAPLRQELNYGREKIKTMINEELGTELVQKVVLC